MTHDIDLHQKVSSRSAVDARFSLFTDTDALAVINTCRNRVCDLFPAGSITASMTLSTLLLYYLTGSSTVRTGLYISHCAEQGLLGKDYLTFTTTL